MGNSKRSHKVAFALGAALVIGASISTVRDRHSSSSRGPRVLSRITSSAWWPGRGDRLLRRSSGGDELLECRLSLFEFIYDSESFDTKDMYMCSPLYDGETGDEEYQIEIDDEHRRAYRKIVRDGFEPVLSMRGATIDEANAQIVLADDSEVTVVNRRRRRKLLATTGKLSALALRIVLNDGSPDYSKDEIYRFMYQDTVSLKNQYKACSMGKLLIEPTSAAVIEVRVNLYGATSSHQTVVNAASLAAVEYLYERGYGTYNQLKAYADLILYITPDMGRWLAYGSVGGAVSVYNNKWGGFIGSIMHETGHNFNLLHAFEGEEYLDYTGYMGGAIISYHDEVGFPSMCFNAANNWQLGWYQDRSLETDLFSPTLIRLAAFVDYDKTTAGQDYVVVRSGNVFMHYNRAKGINQDTYEYQDHLVLYQGIEDGSALFAALSYPDNPVYTRSFPQGTWWAEICDKVEGDGSNPDYLIVSIGFGETSLCTSVSQLEEPEEPEEESVSEDEDEWSSNYHAGHPSEKNVGTFRIRGVNR